MKHKPGDTKEHLSEQTGPPAEGLSRDHEGPTLSFQVDALIDRLLVPVGVDGEFSVQRHVKRGVDGGSVLTFHVQAFVEPPPPKKAKAGSLSAPHP